MRKVVILQYRLLHYRTQLFELLRDKCREQGIEIELVHGQASRREVQKRDVGSLSWAKIVENRFWEIGNKDLLWQPIPKDLRQCDLIVVMQENRILSNYALLLSRLWSQRKIAYWGHGKNFQSTAPTGLRERWKDFLIGRVDWWFAYTQITVDILHKAKFDEARITCLDNAIDSESFVNDLASISANTIADERVRLELGDGPIALFCGSLYDDKRLDLLIDAADLIRTAISGFSLLVVGDGPSMPWLRSKAASRPWIKLMGVRKGVEKALAYSMASIVLNPGAVGLHIVDSFCAGVPLVTTPDAKHGPEIAYLRDGINGLTVADDAVAYARAVVELLRNKATYGSMVEACLTDAKKYTLTNMVDNFAKGIMLCLEMPQISTSKEAR